MSWLDYNRVSEGDYCSTSFFDITDPKDDMATRFDVYRVCEHLNDPGASVTGKAYAETLENELFGKWLSVGCLVETPAAKQANVCYEACG